MPTAEESQINDFKLAQYWHNNPIKGNYAKRIFSKGSKIDYGLSTMEFEGNNSELIGCTALHLAVSFDKTVDVEYLLSRNASLFIKNQNGCTPLHWAVKDNCENPDDSFEINPCCALLLSEQIKLGNSENPSDSNGFTHFHIACMVDHADAVEFFLKSGISVDNTVNTNSPYFPGYTPLHLAARYSALQVMIVLLQSGANTQLKNAEGMTFMCKLFEVRMRILQKLSEYSGCFNGSNIVAANLNTMNFVLQSDSYIIDYAGLTHFHLACSMSELSIAEHLLHKITNINQALHMDAPNWSGCTALHFAAESSLDMVKTLVKNGANILAKDSKGVTPLDISLKKYGLEDIHAILSLDKHCSRIIMSDRKTRLLSFVYAMKDANLFCKYLEPRMHIVNTFVPHDFPLWQGFTPLHIAVMFYQENILIGRKDERFKKIINHLVEKGANINAQDIHGRSPIHLAFRLDREHCIKLLLNFNDKIENTIDEDNLSHLHIACQMGDVASVDKILQNSVNVNLAFKGKLIVSNIDAGATPLHCAATNDKLVNLLLLRGADPYLKDAQGMTAIHHSAGRCDAILSIPNLKEVIAKNSGLSHLHIAVRHQNVVAVEKLLDEGANVNQALLEEGVLSSIRRSLYNRKGDTPLDLAIDEEDEEMIELLMRRGAEILVEDVFSDENTSDALKSVVLSLDLNHNVFKRLEKEITITSLHLACSKRDVNLIKALLASGADVNAQINMRSRLWPGFTPLHIVMNNGDHEQNLDEIVRLLLDYGADITLGTCNIHQTALHLAYENLSFNSTSNQCYLVKMILGAHKDFTVNPSNCNGLSYFHLACSVGDIDTAKQFLEHKADVNQRTNLFRKTYILGWALGRRLGACTPLHFVAASTEHMIDPITQLEMVDLLLNYGADANAQDVNGNTPFHFMAQWNYKREDVILRLIRSNVNVNSKNGYDKTPLMLLIKSGVNVTIDEIRCFLKIGCVFNVFDPKTNEGLIARVLPLISSEDLAYFIKSSMITFSHLMQTDEMGRTVIHNIVSNTNRTNEPHISHAQYVTSITELVKFNYGVDDQDNLGKTPLHDAVLFRNVEAISGLLMAGADVNVIDVNGRTAFSYIVHSECLKGKSYDERQSHNQCDHSDIFCCFMIHMKKLLICGLDVNQINENLMFKAFEKVSDENMTVPKQFEEQINEIKLLKIPGSRLALGNFLGELDAVVAYVTLSEVDRNAVDKFFINDTCHLYTKYSEVAGILFLQYRKAVNRIELNESAKSALNILSRISVPHLCSMEILKYLSNSELKNIIESGATFTLGVVVIKHY